MSKWHLLVVLLGLLLGGWLSVDGVRALVVGDYFTPRTGAHAGQLGPWSQLVSVLGVDPRSTFIKGVHVSLGLLWLISSACLAGQIGGSWWAVVVCAIASLWYLPWGTLIGVVELALLLSPWTRQLP